MKREFKVIAHLKCGHTREFEIESEKPTDAILAAKELCTDEELGQIESWETAVQFRYCDGRGY